jgi:hypothetical protein
MPVPGERSFRSRYKKDRSSGRERRSSSAAQRGNLQESLSKIKNGLVGMYGLARALPVFLRERITVRQAEEEIKNAVRRRGETFLESARTLIYANPSSLYLRLLRIAGCDFSDLRAQVLADGLEATLERLAREGVYLTSDEFKGKIDIVRGANTFRASGKEFERRDLSPGFVMQTSGTTNQPVRTLASLDRLAFQAWATAVFFSAHEVWDSPHAVFDAILPGSGGTNNLLIYAKLGIATERWFACKIPSQSRLEAWSHFLTTYLIVWMGKLYGPGFPRPRFVDVGEMEPIVRWLVRRRTGGKTCCIKTAASNAVRIARAAHAMGASLEGIKFIVSGEPYTEAKHEVVARVGSGTTSRYSFADGGIVGFGCANPVFPDEIHVLQYLLAPILHPKPLDDNSAVRPFLFTTVQPVSAKLLLNVENGDYGTLEQRDCGCALEKAGLTVHLHHIRSFEKFTSEGMNYFYGDLYEFFEKTLPVEFGGGPGDYQIVEEEDENGQTRLTLRAHPQIGAIDEAKLLARLNKELARHSWNHEFQTRTWERAGTLRVRREAPFASARGKILPLQMRR